MIVQAFAKVEQNMGKIIWACNIFGGFSTFRKATFLFLTFLVEVISVHKILASV